MAEIEIRTGGELLLAGEVVGQITWARPYIERDVAGAYDSDPFLDEFGDHYCPGCDEKGDALDGARDVVERVLDRIVKCEAEAAHLRLAGEIPHHLEQMRRDLDALDLEP